MTNTLRALCLLACIATAALQADGTENVTERELVDGAARLRWMEVDYAVRRNWTEPPQNCTPLSNCAFECGVITLYAVMAPFEDEEEMYGHGCLGWQEILNCANDCLDFNENNETMELELCKVTRAFKRDGVLKYLNNNDTNVNCIRQSILEHQECLSIPEASLECLFEPGMSIE